MVRISTGLRRALMTQYGLGQMMNGGIIYVFGGNQPELADDAANTPILAAITTEGRTFIAPEDPYQAGLYLKIVNGEMVVNDPSRGQWRLKGRATGTAFWWRWCWASTDSLEYSRNVPRIDGRVGGTLFLRTVNIHPTLDLSIDSFLVSMAPVTVEA